MWLTDSFKLSVSTLRSTSPLKLKAFFSWGGLNQWLSKNLVQALAIVVSTHYRTHLGNNCCSTASCLACRDILDLHCLSLLSLPNPALSLFLSKMFLPQNLNILNYFSKNPTDTKTVVIGLYFNLNTIGSHWWWDDFLCEEWILRGQEYKQKTT